MLRALHRSFLRALAALLLVSLLLGLASCGGGSGEKTVATVGHTKLTQATLSHWMGTVLGGDYRASLGATAPEGLVSDPADYSRCASAAARVAPGKAKLSDAELRLKCRQLNAGIKQQALAYVLSVLWQIEEGNELGSPATEAEVTLRMGQLAARDYHGPAQFAKTLATLRRTVADERFLVKRNILEDRFLARAKKKAAETGGGPQTIRKLVLQRNAKWTARTNCSPGYLAWECKQYGSSKEVSPAPAVVLEELAQGR
jgi:hypothetical protein